MNLIFCYAPNVLYDLSILFPIVGDFFDSGSHNPYS